MEAQPRLSVRLGSIDTSGAAAARGRARSRSVGASAGSQTTSASSRRRRRANQSAPNSSIRSATNGEGSARLPSSSELR